MNNKLFYLTFIFLILSFITGYFAIPVNDELANIVDKRHQCSCSVFFADFDCKGSEGPAIGLMTFSQNELGHTTISGIFKAGFTNSTDPPKVTIEDHCGNEIVDISSLDIEPTDDNGTKSFRKMFKNLSINCGSNSVFAKNQRSCHNSHSQKRAGPPSVTVPGSKAPLTY